MNILIDSSVWIDYFKGKETANQLDFLIDENLICINDLILAEIIPFLRDKKYKKLISLFDSVFKADIIIDWNEIIKFQKTCLDNGINKIGVPDLIIIQNVRNNNLKLFSLDKHFKLINKHIEFKLWE